MTSFARRTSRSRFARGSARGALLSLIGVLAVMSASVAGAAPGALDETFGSGGVVLVAPGKGTATGWELALRPDGGIVVAGHASSGTSGSGLVQLEPDGVLDPTLDGDGILAGVTPRGHFGGVALASGGRLVAAGGSTELGFDLFSVLRFAADGTIDPSFGSGGVTEIAGTAHALVLLDDERILVAGHDQAADAAAVYRLTAAGLLDETFGDGGVTIIPGGTNPSRSALGLAVQPDGKIVVVGGGDFAGTATARDGFLARLEPDGGFDASFGTGGIVATHDLPGVPPVVGTAGAGAAGVLLLPDERIVVTGVAIGTGGDDVGYLARYSSAGGLDASFGTSGVAFLPGGDRRRLLAVRRQPDGKLLAVGYSFTSGDGNVMLVSRWDADGTLDPTFGGAGMGGEPGVSLFSAADLGMPEPRDGIARAVDVLPDGRIVVVGSADDDDFDDRLVVLRLLGDCANGVLDAGEACDDGNVFAHDCCSPACQLEAAGTTCDGDGDLCTNDRCDGAGACAAIDDGPSSGCRVPVRPAQAVVTLKDGPGGTGDLVSWKWKGEATTRRDLATPLTFTDYALCVYDLSGGTPTLLLGATAPADGTCGAKPCWTAVGTNPAGSRGFKYRNKARTPAGLDVLVLKPGDDGRAQMSVKGRGELLITPSERGVPLPAGQPVSVRVQLKHRFGECWEAHYSTAMKNDGLTFQARSD